MTVTYAHIPPRPRDLLDELYTRADETRKAGEQA